MGLFADYIDRDFAGTDFVATSAFAAGWFVVEEAAAVGVVGFADIARTIVVEDVVALAAA